MRSNSVSLSNASLKNIKTLHTFRRKYGVLDKLSFFMLLADEDEDNYADHHQDGVV